MLVIILVPLFKHLLPIERLAVGNSLGLPQRLVVLLFLSVAQFHCLNSLLIKNLNAAATYTLVEVGRRKSLSGNIKIGYIKLEHSAQRVSHHLLLSAVTAYFAAQQLAYYINLALREFLTSHKTFSLCLQTYKKSRLQSHSDEQIFSLKENKRTYSQARLLIFHYILQYMEKRALTLLSATLLALTTASAQQRDFIETVPDSWAIEDNFASMAPPDDAWWHIFGDARLDSLIAEASRHNFSIVEAIDNIRIAKAQWRQAQALMLPSISLDAGWQRSRTSGSIKATGDASVYDGYFDAAANVSWQVDVFGTLYKRSRAQKELYGASREEYRSVLITLYANVATGYFSLLQSIEQLEVLNESAASQREIMNLVEVRYNSGLASKLDLAQARSVYYSTLASIPSTEGAVQQYRHSLAVLLGRFPQEFAHWPHNAAPLPHVIDPVAVGVPAALLRRRPDVRAAERRTEAYAQLLGASKRDWLPTFYLNGSIGFSSSSLKELPRERSMTWQIAPAMSWSIFDGGKELNATREAQARLDQSITQFNSTLLTALQEVENALSLYRSSIKQIVVLRETVNQCQETLTLSLELYKQGLTQFQNVLDAQRTLLNYRNYLVQARASSLKSLIGLYEALGGGWQ